MVVSSERPELGGSRSILGVIFDMDGVIVDSEPRHEQAFNEVVESIGFGEGKHGLKFSHYVGRSDQELWVDFVNLNRPAQTLQELLALKRTKVVEILRRDQPLFRGLPELLALLSGKYRLALASGSERPIVNEVLKLGGIGRYFLNTVSGSDITRGKPAPDIFLKTAALLGVHPENCCVIEDSKPGVAAGLAAGMLTIAITNTHPAEELAHADHVVQSYEEIARLLV